MEFDKYISEIVAKQFPSFYQAEGENFVAFVRAYYEWMEQSGYTINASKSLLEYKDVDTTIDQFLANFKEEFLINFPSITSADKKFLVKHIKDFYQTKGSVRGMQLLFRLLFDEDIEVYDPGTDILRASDGIWKIPRYLEVEHTPRSKTFVNQSIVGSISDATAFVESVYTKVVNNRLIDVLMISNVKGKFLFQETVTDDGNLYNALKILGSLTAVTVTDGGANNRIGDVLDLNTSTSGIKGQIKVTAIEDGTGRVIFNILDGGSGYTNAASQVHVSEKVLVINNKTNSNGTTDYNLLDTISQPLSSLTYTISTPSSPNTSSLYHSNVYGYDGGGTVVSTGFIAAIATSPANTIIINRTNGNFTTATTIGTTSNAVLFTGYTLSDVTATGAVTGSNELSVGLHDINNTFYANGAYIVSSANVYANVSSISTGTGAGFEIGSLSDTESVFLFTDLLSGNNVNDIPWVDMVISGGNSNAGLIVGTQSITCNTATNAVTGIGGTLFETELIVGSGLYDSSNVYLGTVNSIASNTSLTLSSNALANVVTGVFSYNLGQYGFPKDNAIGYNGIIGDALTSNTFTIGTIASLTAINPASDYNREPFVLIRNDYIAGFNRKNIIVEVTSKTGLFSINDSVTQNINSPAVSIEYNSNTGSFTAGEGVTQSNGSSNAYATISSVDSTTLVLRDVSGTFRANSAGGAGVFGLTSGSTANADTVSASTIATVAKGTIVALPNSTIIELKRTSFNESFQTGSTLNSSSGGTAVVVSSYQNESANAMGENAVINAHVSTAKGIATEVQVVFSGYGHQPNDVVEFVSSNNQFAITGLANVYNQGIGFGYWKNTQGMLSSDKYIYDGTYYQDFSYEIQSRLSLDTYADILKQLAHVVGTKMFGRVNINSSTIKPLTPTYSAVEQYYQTVTSRAESTVITRGNEIVLLRQ